MIESDRRISRRDLIKFALASSVALGIKIAVDKNNGANQPLNFNTGGDVEIMTGENPTPVENNR